jgi:hypothetical membrane protein
MFYSIFKKFRKAVIDISKLYQYHKYLGILGVGIIWLGVAAAMYIGKLGLFSTLPISSLGVNPRTSILFSISLLLSSVFFIKFAYYVSREFNVKNKFLLYFLIGQIGQIIVAIAPYGNHSRYKLVHTVAAFVLAFSLPFLIQQFYYSQAKSSHKSLYKNLLVLEILLFIIGIGAFVFTKGIAPLGEILPTLGFHIWIIVVSIISFRKLDSHLVDPTSL